MPWTKPRTTWSILAACTLAVAILTIYLTDWFALDPCYLCVFQRLLLFVMGLAAIAAAILAGTRTIKHVPHAIFMLATGSGLTAASYQTWLQAQPMGSASCTGGSPGLIERLVEWLGSRWPDIFLATGFCEETGMTIVGLSLANWALICFALCASLGGWLWWQSRPDDANDHQKNAD